MEILQSKEWCAQTKEEAWGVLEKLTGLNNGVSFKN